jgi:hypothetical protein
MEPGRRVDLIKEAATLLAATSDIDLVLNQFGATTAWVWKGTTYSYCVAMIQDLADEKLLSLHGYLAGQTVTTGLEPWQPGRLRLFVSHLYSERQIAGAIKDALAAYGIDAFVAHDSIEPSLEWRDVIEAALRSCDAAVALLHEGFPASKWTDQEVGYLLARRVPALPLIFALDPYGFLDRYQGARCQGMNAVQIAELVVRWLKGTPSTASSFADGLVAALENAHSFDHVRRIFPLIEGLPSLSPDQLRRLEAAAHNNVNVQKGEVDWEPAPARIRTLVARHNPPALPSADVPPF